MRLALALLAVIITATLFTTASIRPSDECFIHLSPQAHCW